MAKADARWHIVGDSPDLIHEQVVAKDSYETPAWIFEYFVAREHLSVDINSSAFNTVLSQYVG